MRSGCARGARHWPQAPLTPRRTCSSNRRAYQACWGDFRSRHMSYVTILWSVAAAAALLLGLVQTFVWALDRRAWGNLAFAIIAFSVAATVPTELGMMHAGSPQ